MKTSEFLKEGSLYTRRELSTMFNIKDATINNGHFRPKDHESIWVFVTENKTPDRVQYDDRLMGDDLYTDGQLAGRTDSLLMEHEKRGLEVLVFWREDKNQFPGAGFVYEGRFRYIDSQGTRPRKFHFRRVMALAKSA